MGIPKLTGRLSHYKQLKDGSFMEGADMYIDGKNFVHSGEERFNRLGFLAVFQHNLGILKSLKAHSMTIYFDAYFPLDKIPTKLVRSEQKLRGKTWDNLSAGTSLALEELKRNHPDIEVVLTGTEAEDQIFWDLAQKQGNFHRPQLVLSSDSDCFTFEVPGSSNVLIVSLSHSDAWPRIFEVYRLSDVVRSARVQQYLHAPEKPIARTLRNPVAPETSTLELLNMYESYNAAIVCLSLIPTDIYDPWEVGTKWRQAAYSVLLKDGIVVTEYRQMHLKVQPAPVVASSTNLEAFAEELKTRPPMEIIADNIEQVFSDTKDQLEHKAVFLQYLESLKTSTEFNIRANFPSSVLPSLERQCNVWCAAAFSTFLSMRFLACALKMDVELYLVGWKLNPGDLYMAISAHQS